MTNQREKLRNAAAAFCEAFAGKKSIEEVLSHFSSSDEVRAIEHGLPQLAPFLGRNFTGNDGIRQYFEIIGSVLSYENMNFADYVVDADVSKVSVRGRARFTWTETRQSWDEVFTYLLQFDDALKVKTYEVWADTGAAYLAANGELR